MAIGSSIDGRDAVLRERLRSLSDLPLLSDGEELVAAATIADGRDAENELAALGSQPNIDLTTAAELMERVRRGEAARDLLVGSTRRLVVSLARRHPSTPEVTLALLDAGDEAVGRAADRYDPTGGLPFSSFARWWVERAMREVDRHPSQGRAENPSPADPVLLTALGHLHREDTRVVELRLGLHGGPALSDQDTARVLGIDTDAEHEREQRAVAKLRHPCTPGDLTHLRSL
ncbi:MAG TPA: hypothetical protein VNQ33_04990 [Acidimicrobiales bacterium]|nr:hypothetical protein [Acidimicrobiales bacterium]